MHQFISVLYNTSYSCLLKKIKLYNRNSTKLVSQRSTFLATQVMTG